MSSVDRPELVVRHVGDVAVVRLINAEILYEESAVRVIADGLIGLLQQGHPRLLVSLGGVRYICSSMLARLVDLERKVRKAGGRLCLCELGPTVHDVFKTSHLDGHFQIGGTEAEALAGFTPA